MNENLLFFVIFPLFSPFSGVPGKTEWNYSVFRLGRFRSLGDWWSD